MSIYKNIGSLREGEMFLSEDSKTLQIVRDGELSIVDPTSLVDIDEIYKMSWKLPSSFNLPYTVTDTVNNILYMWEREREIWISFVLEKSKSPGISYGISFASNFNSLYPGLLFDKFGNISLDFETAGL